MCGIVGILYKDERRRIDLGELHRMNDRIHHRGPDESGHIDFGHFGMAMRRLSIIDLANGKQPIPNEDQSVWVVMNGEIYNHRELRRELSAAGHRFRTSCDTEVLVHAYERYGESFAEKLNGMFAFALWDAARNRLIVGRDRLGIKPLFLYEDGDQIAFASEIKALAEVASIRREVDLTALDQFMTFEYVLTPGTLWKGVRKLEPAHVLVIEHGKARKIRYWDPRVSAERERSEAEAAAELRTRLRCAVERQMVSDVPVGAFLSGGIDSSIVVALMSELQARPVKTFSIGFDDRSYNELEFARAVAKRYGTEHHERILKPDPKRFLEDFLVYLDEPIGDVSMFPTFLVSQLARSHVKVVLSGDGGDELFGGYDWYVADRMEQIYRRAAPAPVRHAIRRVADHVPPTRRKKGLINKVKRFVEGADAAAYLHQYRWMMYLNPEQRERLYAPAFYEAVENQNPAAPIMRLFHEADVFRDDVNRAGFVDLAVFLADDILPKVDVTSMATSLEVRVPYLDHELVEFALSLPGRFKINRLERKVLLRKAFSDVLPPEIVRRRKEGFSIPLKNWLQNEMRDAMHEVLSSANLRETGYFNPTAVDRLIREHESGERNNAHLIWCLMVFHLWHRKFMAGNPASGAEQEAVCLA